MLRLKRGLTLLLLLLGVVIGVAGASRAEAPVYVIKLDGPVWPGQVAFVRESLEKAQEQNARLIVLEINTFGGMVNSATEIRDAVQEVRSTPTVAWVHNRAISAGALIALSAKKIAMTPGSTIGAAAVVDGGGDLVKNPKVLSYWRREFATTAKAHDRDPDLAIAMVSAEKNLPNVGIQAGDILTLSDDDALKYGIADFSAQTLPELLSKMNVADSAPITVSEPGMWERTARYVVMPWATVALLSVGCALLFIELLTLHTWGLTGTLGAAAIVLVLAAHISVGTAGWVAVALLLVGLVFLLLETHVFPGFGLSGILGFLLVFLGFFFALGGSENAVFALGISSVFMVAMLIGFFAYLPRSAVWKAVGLQMQQRASLGYVTSDDYSHFMGLRGKSVTVLRPSGIAEIAGVRLDVVTEGEFLDPGTPVIVTRVEGCRIVVDDTTAATPETSVAAAKSSAA